MKEKRSDFYRALAAVAVGVILVGLLYPWSVPLVERLDVALWNWGHFPAFFCLSGVVFWFSRVWLPLRPVSLAAVMMVFVVGVELTQGLTGREPEWGDLLPGIMGVLAYAGTSGRGDASPKFGAVLLLLISLQPVGVAWLETREAQRSLPLLEAFDDPVVLSKRWTVLGGEVIGEGKTGGLVFQMGATHPYPGLFMRYFPRDWSVYEALVVTLVVLGDKPLCAFVRVDDRNGPPYSDRFQKAFMLTPGRHVLRIKWKDLATEQGRTLALNRIATWGLFFDERAHGQSVELMEARFEH